MYGTRNQDDSNPHPKGGFQCLGAALWQQPEQMTVVIAWWARYDP